MLALLAGCAGVPDGGSVHLGRALPAVAGPDDAFELDVKALPPLWRPGMTPDEVVGGFLHAVVNSDGDYAIARSYLSSNASRTWDPSRGLTTYDSVETVTTGTGLTRLARLIGLRVGRMDARGDFDPSRGEIDETLTLTRSDGQWRIDKLPDGVLLSALDAARSVRLAKVYYVSRFRRALVPEQVFLQTTRSGFATALVRTLLTGPGAWLAPAVARPAPVGTQLLGNVPVVGGVADVNLSPAVRQASSDDLRALSAEIVWTLRQVSDVQAVQLLVDGSPLSVPGVAARQRMTDWPEFDPDPVASGAQLLAVSNGRVVAPGGIVPPGAAHIRDAVSVQASPSGDRLAVVRRTPAGMVLVTGPWRGPLVARVRAAAMSGPTFDGLGDVLVAVSHRSGWALWAATPAGVVRSVAAEDLPRGALSAVAVSSDGARIALVAGGRLFVGRVQPGRDVPSVAGLRDVAPATSDVRGVAWADSGDLAITAASGRSTRTVLVLDVDGYSAHVVGSDGLVGLPIDVAASPGHSVVVATSAGYLWADRTGWHRIGHGQSPAYPD